MKKSFFAVLMILWVVFSGFAEENSYANRNTALKYLKLAFIIKASVEKMSFNNRFFYFTKVFLYKKDF